MLIERKHGAHGIHLLRTQGEPEEEAIQREKELRERQCRDGIVESVGPAVS